MPVRGVDDQDVHTGFGQRPRLGGDVTVDADGRRDPEPALGVDGVIVLRVDPGSAAAAAGLTGATVSADGAVVPGDIIVAVDGKPVPTVGKLLSRLDDFKVGEVVHLTVVRDGQKRDVTVTLQPGA